MLQFRGTPPSIPVKLANCARRRSVTVFPDIPRHLKDGQASDAEILFPGSYRAVNVRNEGGA